MDLPAQVQAFTPESATTLAALGQARDAEQGRRIGRRGGTDSRLVKPLWSCHCASFGFWSDGVAYPIAHHLNHGATARILGHSEFRSGWTQWSWPILPNRPCHPLAPPDPGALASRSPTASARWIRGRRLHGRRLPPSAGLAEAAVSRPLARGAPIALEIDWQDPGGSGV